MRGGCSGYLCLRVVLGSLDTASDLLLCAHLLLEQHTAWAAIVGGWVVIGLLASLLAVAVQRCRHGSPLPAYKYLLLTLKVHTEYGEAFFQSGPQLITQLVLFWTGVHTHDFQTYLGDPLEEAGWWWAWLEVASLALSLTSLSVTGVWYNQEPGPACRTAAALLAALATAAARVFLLSATIVISPLAGLGVLCSLYLASTVLHLCSGEGSLSLAHAYFSLYLPLGHNLGYTEDSSASHKTSHSPAAVLRRVARFHSCHLAASLLLLVPYLVLVEQVVHSPALSPDILLDTFHSRAFTHTAPLLLLALAATAALLHYAQARRARAAAETWGGMATSTPARATSPAPRHELAADTSPVTARSPLRPAAQQLSRPTSPVSERPCSQMYPYLPSAPSYSGGSPEHGALSPAAAARDSFPGARRCEDEACVTCAWLQEGPNFQSSATRKKYKFMTPATCTDTCVVYLVTCKKCSKQFVGKAEGTLRQSNAEHRAAIERQETLLGRHFASVCGLANWSLAIIDKCPPGRDIELDRRHRFWLDELVTRFPVGLNESQGASYKQVIQSL